METGAEWLIEHSDNLAIGQDENIAVDGVGVGVRANDGGKDRGAEFKSGLRLDPFRAIW